jgi:hypothetical protein
MAGAAAPFKLAADVPVLGSARYSTHASWSRAFQLYVDCFPALTPAMTVDPTKLFVAYTAAESRSNANLRLVLHNALNEEHWSIIDSEPRGVCNLARLRQTAMSSDLSHASDLQVDLSCIMMHNSETLQTYWSRGLKLQSRLNAVNIPTSDTTLVMWLLRGLPTAYDHYRSIATLHVDANLDAFSMLAFLQVHEHHLQRQSKQVSTQPSLPAKFQRKCHQCGSVDHLISNCPSRAQSSPQVSSVFSRIECSHCHRLGHTADKCYGLHPNLRPSSSAQHQSSSLPGPPPRQCSNCHMLGHTKEFCYHLIGFPKKDSHTSRERSRSPSASRQGARTNHVNASSGREATPFSLTQG